MATGGYLYMCFDGQTIVDACMTSNLQGNGHGLDGVQCQDCDPCCEDLNKALGRPPGGPSITQAPWYDEDDPRSVEFAGLLVTSVTGLNPGAFTRDVAENANIGANLGASRNLAPVIEVTALMLGSCCGVEYGLSWLRSALRGSCKQGRLCQGGTLEFLSCPPVFPDEDCPENEGQDYYALLTPYIRKFQNVGLVSGPTPEFISHGCPTCHDCPMTQVTFTMSAADPCVYREPVGIVDTLVFEDFAEDCFEWITEDARIEDPDLDCDDECPDLDTCATDPKCVDVAPPKINQFFSDCAGCTPMNRKRACFEVDTALIPPNGEATLRLEIFAGNKDMRGVQVMGWHDPTGAFGPDDMTECNACFGVNVSFVGAGTTLVVDGATRTATIECAGGRTVRANPFISSTGGSPSFTFPDFEGCATGKYIVCVYASDTVSNQAKVDAVLIGREC